MQGGSNRFVCKTIYLKLNNAEYNPKLEVSNLMKLCSVSVSATKNDSSNRHKNVAATKLVHSLDLIAAADDEEQKLAASAWHVPTDNAQVYLF
jgi:hypothetical protein